MDRSGLTVQPVANTDGFTSIGSEMFGGIFTTFQHKNWALSDYENHEDAMGLTHVRWPGGTFAKRGKDTSDWDGDGDTNEFAYDLSNPDVHLKAEGTGNNEFGLSGALEHAIANGQSFSMIVPVERYIDDLDNGEQILDQFLHRLLIEKEFGDLPSDFTLEMGNENLKSGDIEFAKDYGAVSNAFTTIIRKYNEDPGLTQRSEPLKVAIQGGPDAQTDAAIREQISDANTDSVDSVIYHYLSTNIRNLQTNISNRTDEIDAWEDQFGDDLEVFASAWTVGVSRYPNTNNHDYIDAGAEASRTTIESLVAMSESGVDKAAIWGVDLNLDSNGVPQNPNWFSSGANGEVVLSHAGHVVQMMSESVVDKPLIFSQGNKAIQGALVDGEFPGLDSVAKYVFQGTDELVIFLAANDISNSGEEVSINVSAFASQGDIQVTRLSTNWRDPNNPYDDVALRETSDATFENGTITMPLLQDHEFIRIVMPFNPDLVDTNTSSLQGTNSNDLFFVDDVRTVVFDPSPSDNDLVVASQNYHMKGSANNVENLRLVGSAQNGTGNDLDNDIQGNGLANFISGEGGSDHLHGAASSDTLIGGGGNDTLDGGSGNDVMRGGAGNDVYIVDSDLDLVFEEENGGDDTVITHINTSLWEFSRDIENLQLASDAGNIGAYGNRMDNGMIGNSGNNWLSGGRGDDTIRGWAGNDRLVGGGGDDVLSGNRGNDTLLGGDGADFISGGPGNNVASGGAHSDTFAVKHFGSSLTITDFQLGLDRLLFDGQAIGMSSEQIGNTLQFTEGGNSLILSLSNASGAEKIDITLEGLNLEDQSDVLESMGL